MQISWLALIAHLQRRLLWVQICWLVVTATAFDQFFTGVWLLWCQVIDRWALLLTCQSRPRGSGEHYGSSPIARCNSSPLTLGHNSSGLVSYSSGKFWQNVSFGCLYVQYDTIILHIEERGIKITWWLSVLVFLKMRSCITDSSRSIHLTQPCWWNVELWSPFNEKCNLVRAALYFSSIPIYQPLAEWRNACGT